MRRSHDAAAFSLGQVTASELKARGWSETMIRRFLGEPCSRASNPHCRPGPMMRLYGWHRVQAAEAGADFRQAMEKARAASRRASQAHRAKVEASIREAWRIPIALPQRLDEPMRAAGQADLSLARGGQRTFGMGLDDLVAAGAVQRLLEACEPSLWALDERFGTPGVRAARVVVRKRILSAIAARHPWLRRECLRRFRAETGNVEPFDGI